MHDLTKGSITGHILTMGLFIAVTMLVQTAYFLVDLYFVSRIGKEAVAGVSTAGNMMFLAMAISQAIGVGITSLVARSIGAGDTAAANRLFNQGMGMALIISVITLVVGYAFGLGAVSRLAADDATAVEARSYLGAFIPSLAMMFPTVALGSALRAAGIVRAPTIVQSLSLLLNIILAPVLIAGWGTGIAFGVAGAGWASTIAVGVGLLAMYAIFPRVQSKMRTHVGDLAPRLVEWGRLLYVGAPSAAEFFLMFVIVGVVYYVIREFGAEAQAGFGIGSRVLQSVMLPAMAISFSASPIVGQNLGAGNAARVREAFYTAVSISAAIMVALALLMHISPSTLTAPFSPDAGVLDNANLYLRIISWNLVASGIVFTCSGVFQGMGNTTPSLMSSASRIFTFVLPALWLEQKPHVTLEEFWWLSVASTGSQAIISLALVFRELRRKLGTMPTAAAPAAP
ncbi:MAG: MATE family efflux transporter [Alphaproteobacteria bacterium]|nr:MATE family efflux transporter [Alphaproteobacteria bacterium]